MDKPFKNQLRGVSSVISVLASLHHMATLKLKGIGSNNWFLNSIAWKDFDSQGQYDPCSKYCPYPCCESLHIFGDSTYNQSCVFTISVPQSCEICCQFQFYFVDREKCMEWQRALASPEQRDGEGHSHLPGLVAGQWGFQEPLQ